MSGRVVSIDGLIRDPTQAVVSVFDRGFLYGDAVFEVFRTYRGIAFALGEHLARLRRSAERVLIALPVEEGVLRGEIEAALAAAGNEESYVRVVVTRGSGPLSLDPDTATHPLRVIIVEPVVPPPRAAYVDGVALRTVRARRATDDTSASGAKVTNYLSNLLAIKEAKSSAAHEALILGTGGQVVEGASSNVFIVSRGVLVTPPESSGILAGITRANVLAAAAALNIRAEERSLSIDEVYGAQEVFITSSVREVLPVVRVDDRVIGAGVPGPVTRALHRRFRDGVGMGGTPMPYDA